MRLSIKNFQSIKNAQLEFPEGITIITGSSNSGKTAILRSFRAALLNPKNGKDYIKSGENENCSVILEDNGDIPTIEWLRKPSTVSYVIDGETNEKCGRSNIWDLVPKYDIIQEPDGSIFNFHTETDILFPFGFSSAELFRIFERIIALDDTSSVFKAMREDLNSLCTFRKQVNRKLTYITVEKEELKNAVEKLKTIIEEKKNEKTNKQCFGEEEEETSIEEIFQEINNKTKDFECLLEKSEKVKNFNDSVHNIEDKLSILCDILSEKNNKYNNLSFVLEKLSDSIVVHEKETYSVLKKLCDLTNVYYSLDLLSNISVIGNIDVSEVKNLGVTTKQFYAKFKEILNVEKRMNILSLSNKILPFNFHEQEGLLDKVRQSYNQINSFSILSNVLISLSKIREIDRIEFDDKNFTVCNALLLQMESTLEIEKKIGQISFTIDKLSVEMCDIKEEISKFDVCPLCGSSLTKKEVETE